MGVKHSFTSSKSDDGDSTLVKPSDWNAEHILVPEVVQYAVGTNTISTLTLGSAPVSGHTLILYTDSTTGQVSTVSSTNTTWTQLTTQSSGSPTYGAVWIGKVSGTGGTSISLTKPGTYLTATVVEITDSVGTPSLGASSKGSFVSGTNFLTLTGGTFGRLVVYGMGVDNTTNLIRPKPSNPTDGVAEYYTTLLVGYSTTARQNVFAYTSDAGHYILCEVY